MKTLNDFAKFLAWTEHVRDVLRLSVEFENGPTIPFDDPKLWNTSLDPAYWQAMFTSSSPVKPYAIESLGKVPILSYPVKEIEQFVKEKYATIAAGFPGSYPPVQEVLKTFEDVSLYEFMSSTATGKTPGAVSPGLDVKSLQMVQPSLNTMSAPVRARMQRNMEKLVKGPGMRLKSGAAAGLQSILKDLAASRRILTNGQSAMKNFMAFSLFHTPMDPAKPMQPGKVFPTLPEVEFHEAVSSLGDYPELMRKLGLVIDITIPAGTGIPASSFVAVKANWKSVFTDSASLNFSAKTKYTLTTDDFRAAPRPGVSAIKNGVFDLSDPTKFDVVQLDVDGAAMKLKALMGTIEQGSWDEALPEPVMLASAGGLEKISGLLKASAVPMLPFISLPSLRTQGIALVRRDHSGEVLSRIDAQAAYNVNLTYAQLHPAVLTNPSPPKSESDKADVRLYAEDLVRGYRVDAWSDMTGKWLSLCKRKTTVSFGGKPGLSHAETAEGYVSIALTAPPPADGETDAGSPDEMRLSENICRWDGWSLVAPRPGKRVSDLDEVENNDNPPVTFTKLSATTEAESGTLPRLRFGRKYRLRARIADLAGNGRDLTQLPVNDVSIATRETTYLRLEPAASPTVVLRTPAKPGESVERVILRSNYDATVAAYLSAHDLDDPVPERHVLAPRCSQQMAEYHGRFDGLSAADAYALIVSREGFPAKIYTGETVTVPYLPDPLARGVALSFFWNGLPVGPVQYLEFLPGGTGWPNVRSFRIRVEEHTDAVTVEKSADTLVIVKVPKAGVVTVRYSSYVDDAGANLLGIASWVGETSTAASAKVKEEAKKGQHWMITPYRELRIVHAVQQPLLEPSVEKWVPIKTYGATFAMIHGKIGVHGRSTDRFDVRAEWSEPFDDITMSEWAMVDGKGQAFSLPVKETDKSVLIGDQNVAVQSPGKEAGGQVSMALVLPGAQPPVSATPAPALQSPVNLDATTHADQRHDFGDTKYRKVRYTVVAVSRFRECFLDLLPTAGDLKKAKTPVPFTRDRSVEAVVLNSARPHAPKVKYCVPTFQWERKEDARTIISRRCGGGIRVFLERPWFSSGDGELLGVVVRPGGKPLDENDPDDNRLRPYVTQWGLDPIVRSGGAIKAAPTLADFKNTERKQVDVTLEELPLAVGTANIGAGVPLHVAGYKPVFDKERNLWFTDVVLDPGQAYFPFVRLALVRFQPNSIVNAHLSRAVLTDFMQVVPDRVAAVTFDTDTKITVQVAGVYASRYPGEVKPLAALNRSMYLTATLEKKVGEGDLTWIPVSGTMIPGPADEPDAADRMVPTELHETKMRWVREITLSEPVAKGSKQYRITVREFEVHHDAAGERVTRLVYADAIEL